MKRGRITKKKTTNARRAKVPEVFVRVSPVRTATHRSSESERTTRPWPIMARMVAGVLVCFFVFVPIGDMYAHADEVVSEAPAPVAELVSTEEPAEVAVEVSEASAEPVLAEEPVIEETPIPVEETAGVPEEVLPASDSETPEPIVDTEATTTDAAVETTTDIGPEDTTGTVETEIATATPSVEETSSEETSDTATTTETSIEEIATSTPPIEEIIPENVEELPVATTTATTTDKAATTTAEIPDTSTHTTDADRFTFGVTECVALGNGAFQCVRGDESDGATAVRGPLYAAKDATGDMEIYLLNDSGSRPITQNDYDDDAPSADPVNGDIVWHAQIDDRSQVMYYNRETGATTRITKEAYNSMQPSIYDGDIVFQAWIGNDWEIVLVDDTDGREILTDNDQHDITPSITKDYIMWQAFEGEEWVGKVYDRRTKEIETVHGMDGGKVENPRMIMVFDSTQENGDTDTLGYDPVSGEVVSLAVTPVPQSPERIPEPEPEQEEKALVQPSVTTRTETKNATSTDPGDGAAATSTEPTTDTASSTSVVIPTATTSHDGIPTLDLNPEAPETNAPNLPNVIPDLVIPAFSSSTNDEATTSPNI